MATLAFRDMSAFISLGLRDDERNERRLLIVLICSVVQGVIVYASRLRLPDKLPGLEARQLRQPVGPRVGRGRRRRDDQRNQRLRGFVGVDGFGHHRGGDAELPRLLVQRALLHGAEFLRQRHDDVGRGRVDVCTRTLERTRCTLFHRCNLALAHAGLARGGGRRGGRGEASQ